MIDGSFQVKSFVNGILDSGGFVHSTSHTLAATASSPARSSKILSRAASCADFMSFRDVFAWIPEVKTARSVKRKAVLHPTVPSRLINAADSADESST